MKMVVMVVTVRTNWLREDYGERAIESDGAIHTQQDILLGAVYSYRHIVRCRWCDNVRPRDGRRRDVHRVNGLFQYTCVAGGIEMEPPLATSLPQIDTRKQDSDIAVVKRTLGLAPPPTLRRNSDSVASY
jgi:hypothetical protein